MRWLHSDERGAVGGLEMIPFGVLVFITGILLITNIWAVVDAKMAVESAAREAGRAHVESPDEASARVRADSAARSALEGLGRDPSKLELEGGGPFVRCGVIEYRAAYRVPAVSLPFIGGWGKGTTVRGRHREIIDAHRSGIGGRGACG